MISGAMKTGKIPALRARLKSGLYGQIVWTPHCSSLQIQSRRGYYLEKPENLRNRRLNWSAAQKSSCRFFA